MGIKTVRIGVIGDGSDNIGSEVRKFAFDTGHFIAKKNATLVCGGLSGVMKYAAKGAKEAGGLTIGILPGHELEKANEYIDIPIVTGLGEMRNAIVVRNSHILIAVEGRLGTLTEIAFALKFGKKVIGFNTWDLSKDDVKKNVIKVTSAKDAVEKAINIYNNETDYV